MNQQKNNFKLHNHQLQTINQLLLHLLLLILFIVNMMISLILQHLLLPQKVVKNLEVHLSQVKTHLFQTMEKKNLKLITKKFKSSKIFTRFIHNEEQSLEKTSFSHHNQSLLHGLTIQRHLSLGSNHIHWTSSHFSWHSQQSF